MTAIYVTHDQEEALAISDRIAVMAKGGIEQLDLPEEIYSNPRTVFAASFVGRRVTTLSPSTWCSTRRIRPTRRASVTWGR